MKLVLNQNLVSEVLGMNYLTQILESGLMIPFAFLTAVVILGIGFLF